MRRARLRGFRVLARSGQHRASRVRAFTMRELHLRLDRALVRLAAPVQIAAHRRRNLARHRSVPDRHERLHAGLDCERCLPSGRARTVPFVSRELSDVAYRGRRRYGRFGARGRGTARSDASGDRSGTRSATPRRNLGRACLAFHLPHRAGSLHTALAGFARRGLNLRNLVVRPRRGRPFEYTFYAELEVDVSLDNSVLTSDLTPESRLLGRY